MENLPQGRAIRLRILSDFDRGSPYKLHNDSVARVERRSRESEGRGGLVDNVKLGIKGPVRRVGGHWGTMGDNV